MNKKPIFNTSVNVKQFATSFSEAMKLLYEITESDSYKNFQRHQEESAKQSRWATDPLNLMRYWNYFKLVSLRRNPCKFLVRVGEIDRSRFSGLIRRPIRQIFRYLLNQSWMPKYERSIAVQPPSFR
jgi:hypothetical protein